MMEPTLFRSLNAIKHRDRGVTVLSPGGIQYTARYINIVRIKVETSAHGPHCGRTAKTADCRGRETTLVSVIV